MRCSVCTLICCQEDVEICKSQVWNVESPVWFSPKKICIFCLMQKTHGEHCVPCRDFLCNIEKSLICHLLTEKSEKSDRSADICLQYRMNQVFAHHTIGYSLYHAPPVRRLIQFQSCRVFGPAGHGKHSIGRIIKRLLPHISLETQTVPHSELGNFLKKSVSSSKKNKSHLNILVFSGPSSEVQQHLSQVSGTKRLMFIVNKCTKMEKPTDSTAFIYCLPDAHLEPDLFLQKLKIISSSSILCIETS